MTLCQSAILVTQSTVNIFSVSFPVLISCKKSMYVNTSGSIIPSSKTKQPNLGQTVTFALKAYMIKFSAFFPWVFY